jgi:hypothetical protein
VEKSGGRYVLASLQPQIAKVFEIARSLPTGRLFASVKEADDYLAAIQSQELKRQKGVDKEGEDEEV